MSIVSLQLGQCGNQIGWQFFNSVISDVNQQQNPKTVKIYDNERYKEASLDRFFEGHEAAGKVKMGNGLLIICL